MQKIVVLILVIIAMGSCNNQSIIPEKDMVSILAKIQIIDASVQHQKYRSKFFDKDTIDYYSSTIKSFGYSKVQFDSSLSYYARNPKLLDAIYDKVIIELSKIETKNSKLRKALLDSLERDTSKNYWALKPIIQFPDDDKMGTVDYSIPVLGLGTYTISADVCIFDDDNSIEPSMTAYFYFDDKSKEGNRSSFNNETYAKGGDTLNYSIGLELQNSLVTHLKGSMFAYKKSNQDIKRHASITNIKINYKPVAPKKRPKGGRLKGKQLEIN